MGMSGPSRPAGRERERGSATVLVVAGIGVMVLLLAGALVLTSAVVASHRARAAADLAALAGAQVLVDGDAREPCDVASGVATRNSSALVECQVAGDDLTVTVATRAGWPGLGSARARARAGPEPARTAG